MNNVRENEQWNTYKKMIEIVPSYLVLQKASKIVFDYVDTKRPIEISWDDKEDDFIILWQKLEQISNDLDKMATIDKTIHTIRELDKQKLCT